MGNQNRQGNRLLGVWGKHANVELSPSFGRLYRVDIAGAVCGRVQGSSLSLSCACACLSLEPHAATWRYYVCTQCYCMYLKMCISYLLSRYHDLNDCLLSTSYSLIRSRRELRPACTTYSVEGARRLASKEWDYSGDTEVQHARITPCHPRCPHGAICLLLFG